MESGQVLACVSFILKIALCLVIRSYKHAFLLALFTSSSGCFPPVHNQKPPPELPINLMEQENNFDQDLEESPTDQTIMKNRHLIAHGKSPQITISQVKDYLTKSVEVLDFIEKQCGLKHKTTDVS
jgi:hypothetical protein